MKQYLKKIIIICSLIIICLFPIIPAFADSGYDGSYDSGYSSSIWDSSSSWSDSSSYSDSWSSSYDSSGYHNSSDSLSDKIITNFIMICIFVIIIYVYITYNMKKINKYRADLSNRNNMIISGSLINEMVPYNVNQVKNYLPDFDEGTFLNHAYNIYKEIQIAWMNFDENAIRKYTTDALYNTYSSQLTLLKAKQEKNIMKDFELQQVQIAGMEVKENFVSLAVNMTISCYDYIVDANDKAIRGNENKKVTYNYLMIFNKGLSQKPNKCPNCGATLEEVNSNTCPYCRSNIINESYDWVLSKKQVLSQTKNTHK